MDVNYPLLVLLFFVVAILYSSVGHGGASGYLAMMSFFTFAPTEMASTALILNVLVASLAFYAFRKAGHFSWSLTWPFVVSSIPAAFLGGLLILPTRLYYLILAAVLLFTSIRMMNSVPGFFGKKNGTVYLPLATGWGFAIGLVSGIVGVGGGIFLSPLLLMARWANIKTTAATSAFFIIVNALAGLAGRFARDGIVVGNLWWLVVAGFLGGVIGSRLGANHYSERLLQRVLGAVLLLAAFKLMIQSGIFPK